MRLIRIALADDHTLVRAGLKSLLSHISDVQVVAEAGDGRSLLDLLPRCQPDIALLDLAMPGLNGLETIGQVRRESPGTRVLVLSTHNNPEYVMRALQTGASGYIIKGASIEELETAIRIVTAGGAYLGVDIPSTLVEQAMNPAREPGLQDRLTSRQREILQLLAEGRTNQEIADKLFLSIKTVETHRSQLMRRLGIHDLAGLTRYAIHQGVILPEV